MLTPSVREAAVESREGLLTVYDHEGHYVGCIGSETWQRLLDSEAENSHSGPGS